MDFQNGLLKHKYVKNAWLAGHDLETPKRLRLVSMGETVKTLIEERDMLHLKTSAVLLNGVVKHYRGLTDDLLQDCLNLETSLRKCNLRHIDPNETESTPSSPSPTYTASPERMLTRTSEVYERPAVRQVEHIRLSTILEEPLHDRDQTDTFKNSCNHVSSPEAEPTSVSITRSDSEEWSDPNYSPPSKTQKKSSNSDRETESSTQTTENEPNQYNDDIRSYHEEDISEEISQEWEQSTDESFEESDIGDRKYLSTIREETEIFDKTEATPNSVSETSRKSINATSHRDSDQPIENLEEQISKKRSYPGNAEAIAEIGHSIERSPNAVAEEDNTNYDASGRRKSVVLECTAAKQKKQDTASLFLEVPLPRYEPPFMLNAYYGCNSQKPCICKVLKNNSNDGGRRKSLILECNAAKQKKLLRKSGARKQDTQTLFLKVHPISRCEPPFILKAYYGCNSQIPCISKVIKVNKK